MIPNWGFILFPEKKITTWLCSFHVWISYTSHYLLYPTVYFFSLALRKYLDRNNYLTVKEYYFYLWSATEKQELYLRTLVGETVSKCHDVNIGSLLCIATQSCQALYDPPGLMDSLDYSPPHSSVHGDSLSKNTGVVWHALSQVSSWSGMEPRSPVCRPTLYCLSCPLIIK